MRDSNKLEVILQQQEFDLQKKDEQISRLANTLQKYQGAAAEINAEMAAMKIKALSTAVLVGKGLVLEVPHINEEGEKESDYIQMYHVVTGTGESVHLPATPDMEEILDDYSSFEVGVLGGQTIVSLGNVFRTGEVMPVKKVYEDGRLLLRRHGIDQHILAESVGLLESATIKEGDTVALLPGERFAYSIADRVDNSVHRYIEPLDKSFDDIGGLEKQKSDIREAIDDYFYSLEDLAAHESRLARGILLHGPPGTGKTALAKATTGYLREKMDEHYRTVLDVLDLLEGVRENDESAIEHAVNMFKTAFNRDVPDNLQKGLEDWLELYKVDHTDIGVTKANISDVLDQDNKEIFLHINGADLLDMWLGSQEARLENLFKDAQRQAEEYGMAVVFIDECEGVLGKRSGGRGNVQGRDYMDNLVAKWNGIMDGLEERGNIFVILGSNLIENIDPAAIRPGRVDLKVNVPTPDKEASEKIFGIYFKDRFRYAENTGADEFVQKALEKIYSTKDSYNKLGTVRLNDGSNHDFYFHDLLSGAVIENIAERTKKISRRRRRHEGGILELREEDLEEAISLEREENRHSQNETTITKLGRFKDRRVVKYDPFEPKGVKTYDSPRRGARPTRFLEKGGR